MDSEACSVERSRAVLVPTSTLYPIDAPPTSTSSSTAARTILRFTRNAPKPRFPPKTVDRTRKAKRDVSTDQGLVVTNKAAKVDDPAPCDRLEPHTRKQHPHFKTRCNVRRPTVTPARSPISTHSSQQTPSSQHPQCGSDVTASRRSPCKRSKMLAEGLLDAKQVQVILNSDNHDEQALRFESDVMRA